jgi:hypothetical protein
MPTHKLTFHEALRGVWFPLLLTLNFGFVAFLSDRSTPMVVMYWMLTLLYLIQALRAVWNCLRIRRGETVLVLAPPPSPMLFFWGFGAMIGTAFSLIAFVGALVTIFMVLPGVTAWYVPLAFLTAGTLLAMVARLSWRKLRATQATSTPPVLPEAPPPEPGPENAGRWWTRNDAR